MPENIWKIIAVLTATAFGSAMATEIQAQRCFRLPSRCCEQRPAFLNPNCRVLRPLVAVSNGCCQSTCSDPIFFSNTCGAANPGVSLNPMPVAASALSNSQKTPDANSLFDGKSLDGWNKTSFGGEGEIEVANGQIVFEMGQGLTGINFAKKDFPTDNFELSLQALRLDGIDMICGVTFPVKKEFCSLIVGGWGGATVGLSSIDDKDASANSTSSILKLDDNRWYKIRIRVAGGRIQCYLDDKKVVDHPIEGFKFSLRGDCEQSKPIGIFNFGTRTAIKDVKLLKLVRKQKTGTNR